MRYFSEKKSFYFSVATCCTLLAFARCPPPPPPPPVEKPKVVVIMILVDVTRSLEGGEVTQVAKLAADVLDVFPDNSDYVIYPIQWETERPTPIAEAHGSTLPIKLKTEEKEKRRKDIARKIDKTYADVNAKQPVDRTCILNTLDLAAQHFYGKSAGLPATEQPSCMEMIIISDMIEQCSINAISTRIDLQDQPLTEASELAKGIPSPPNLKGIRVTIIIPTSEESTPFARHRPRLGDLRLFWNGVFERSGLKADELRDLNWLPTLPERLRHVCE